MLMASTHSFIRAGVSADISVNWLEIPSTTLNLLGYLVSFSFLSIITSTLARELSTTEP